MSEPQLVFWTVYSNPRDYPGKFVVRCSTLRPGGGLLAEPEPRAVVDTLEQARAAIPPWLHRQDRDPEDDSVIVELWF